ncbi:hypothetical protein IZ6_16810 [Terrihabitans soli]|uniref:Peptidase S8/S53 domain-containing protein n=1 Tax=Terrihabitans soli TaxID=708113 RepID=A0A6S6QNF8_9HYPH|nr:S8 family serine peptidase [Terrihabitans soli]BCJ90946.1 hypothetical protein IZ6_16810 [Terrihabitans soli]
MNAVTVLIRAALAAAIAAPIGIAFTSVSASDAKAQFSANFGFGGGHFLSQNQGRSRGGGGSGKGGDRFHTDKCYAGLADFCRPKIKVIPQVDTYYYPPEYYEEPMGAPTKKPVKQAKPKKTPEKAGGTPPVARRDFVPNEVLVEVPLSTPESEVDALASAQGIQKLGSTEISLLNTRIYRWRIPNGRPVDQVVAAISADSRVAGAHYNRLFALQQAANNSVPPQYATTKLKLPEAHTVTRGENVLVAVIDSGADTSHPDLKGSFVETFDAVGGKFEPHAHGTGMTGAIVGHGNLQGVAPGARILNVRAFSPTGKTQDGTTFDVVRGMDWAASKGARVFNLSFAGPKDELMSRVIKAAIARGIVVVAAAGNAGPKSPPLYPGAEPGVIAVTSTDATDGVTTFANRGTYLTVAAPGVDILVAAPKKAYAISSGTSISAAYVSGMAALMIARNPNTTPKEVLTVLVGTAKDLGIKGRDKDFGAGLVDSVAALETMEPTPMISNATPPATPMTPPAANAANPTRAGFSTSTTPR